MNHHSTIKSKFLRKLGNFNSTDFMRKSISLSSPSESIDSKFKQSFSLSTKQKPRPYLAIPEIFYVNTEKKTVKKQRETAKQRISVLAEFGFIPETLGNCSSKITSPKFSRSSIKISDFMGKNNREKIFKSLDLRGMVENSSELFAVEEKKNNRKVFIKETKKPDNLKKTDPNFDICRTVGISNGYQNMAKHEESLKKIDLIYKSCDNLLYQSKTTLKSMLSVRLDSKRIKT